MWNALAAMIRRYVPSKDGVYDSVCVPEVNEAFRALAVDGWFVIEWQQGERLFGRFVTKMSAEPPRKSGLGPYVMEAR